MSEPLDAGFSEPVPLHAPARGCSSIPSEGGVYMVTTSRTSAKFLRESVGGHFKGKNPTVSLEVLRDKWVPGSPVLYIGKANSLRRRIDQLARFGRGEPIGHWGGRYMWQLENSDDLQVTWKVDSHPSESEADLIADFLQEFGVLPFANLNQPRGKGARA